MPTDGEQVSGGPSGAWRSPHRMICGNHPASVSVRKIASTLARDLREAKNLPDLSAIAEVIDLAATRAVTFREACERIRQISRATNSKPHRELLVKAAQRMILGHSQGSRGSDECKRELGKVFLNELLDHRLFDYLDMSSDSLSEIKYLLIPEVEWLTERIVGRCNLSSIRSRPIKRSATPDDLLKIDISLN